jgi:5-methylcytosine-specific restriction endonuclease McrA
MSTPDAKVLTTAAYRRLRLAVLDRDLWLCQVKGPTCTRYATQVDHIVARHDGGPVFDPANLRASCRSCNSTGGAEITNRHHRGGTNYVGRF